MTEPPRAVLERFLARLESGPGFAVAKQPDLWANLGRGGDWDLVVGDLEPARSLLVEEVGAPLRMVRRSYVVATFYSWGEIDFLPRIEWKGVELVSASRVLQRAARDPGHGWPVACTAHQAVAGWIYPMLAYGSFNPRYAQLVASAVAEDGIELERVLTDIFGSHADAAIAAARDRAPQTLAPHLANLRRAARVQALSSSPFRTLRAMSMFAFTEVALRLPVSPNVRAGAA